MTKAYLVKKVYTGQYYSINIGRFTTEIRKAKLYLTDGLARSAIKNRHLYNKEGTHIIPVEVEFTTNPVCYITIGSPDDKLFGFTYPGWYFYHEDNAHLSGPFDTEEEAEEQLRRYGKELDDAEPLE